MLKVVQMRNAFLVSSILDLLFPKLIPQWCARQTEQLSNHMMLSARFCRTVFLLKIVSGIVTWLCVKEKEKKKETPTTRDPNILYIKKKPVWLGRPLMNENGKIICAWNKIYRRQRYKLKIGRPCCSFQGNNKTNGKTLKQSELRKSES